MFDPPLEGPPAGQAVFDLIPAIDLRGGQVIRLEQGDDQRRESYGAEPFELLGRFAELGARWVHVVDLDAAFGEKPQRTLLEKLVSSTSLAVELGGGLRDRAAIAWALEIGCKRVVVGSLVLRDFPAFAELTLAFPGRLVPALETQAGRLKIAGWREEAKMTLTDLCQQLRGLPCPAILCTDVERDGTLVGPNLELASQIAADTGLGTIVSGGVGELAHVLAASQTPGVQAVIVGKAFYRGRLDLGLALRHLREQELRRAAGSLEGRP